jgi:hypothetical protein
MIAAVYFAARCHSGFVISGNQFAWVKALTLLPLSFRSYNRIDPRMLLANISILSGGFDIGIRTFAHCILCHDGCHRKIFKTERSGSNACRVCAPVSSMR